MPLFFCITSFLRRWGAAKAINFMSFLEFFLRRTSVAIKLVNLKDLKPQAYSNQSARQPLKSSTIQWQGTREMATRVLGCADVLPAPHNID